ncbi:MAG: RING finger domain-containing protein [Nitrososphaerota archaeon]
MRRLVKTLRSIKVVQGISVGKWVWEILTCDACLLEIEEGTDYNRCSNCGAVFHTDCYKSLIGTKGVCPKCKVALA